MRYSYKINICMNYFIPPLRHDLMNMVYVNKIPESDGGNYIFEYDNNKIRIKKETVLSLIFKGFEEK